MVERITFVNSSSHGYSQYSNWQGQICEMFHRHGTAQHPGVWTSMASPWASALTSAVSLTSVGRQCCFSSLQVCVRCLWGISENRPGHRLFYWLWSVWLQCLPLLFVTCVWHVPAKFGRIFWDCNNSVYVFLQVMENYAASVCVLLMWCLLHNLFASFSVISLNVMFVFKVNFVWRCYYVNTGTCEVIQLHTRGLLKNYWRFRFYVVGSINTVHQLKYTWDLCHYVDSTYNVTPKR